MTVFNTFFKVMREYKVAVIMNLVITVSVIALLSSISDSSTAEYKAKTHGLVIVDQDQTELTEALIDYIGSVNTVKKGEFTDDQITDMLYYTSISNYLVIPKGFTEGFLKGGKDAPLIESTKDMASRAGYSVEGQLESFLELTSGYMTGGYSLSEAAKEAADSISDTSHVKIVSDVKISSERIFIVFQFLPYGIITVLFSAVLPVVLRFNTERINKRTGVSSLPAVKKQIQLALAAGLVSLVVLLALITIGSIMAKEAGSRNWWLIAGNCLVFASTMVMVMVAISNFGLKPDVTSGITNIVALSFSFLGGIFVPLEVLGNSTKRIGQFLPTYWFSQAMAVIKNNEGSEKMIKCLLIQLLFGAMVMMAGLLAGKYRQKKAD